jgi:mono/diheme cytochrome c family protein
MEIIYFYNLKLKEEFKMKRYKITALIFSIFLFVFFIYGNAPALAQTSNSAKAIKIIKAKGCLSCHALNGSGGSVGPNLSNEGSKGHSIHWLKVQITNPGKHFQGSIMPQFQLNSAQLEEVALYLESLK